MRRKLAWEELLPLFGCFSELPSSILCVCVSVRAWVSVCARVDTISDSLRIAAEFSGPEIQDYASII